MFQDETRPKIYFYLPFNKDGIRSVPATEESYWQWITRHREVGEGKYSWTLQTYLFLKSESYPCEIVVDFPCSGIVISHRDFLPVFLRPRSGVFLVCIKPDRKRHTWANCYIVQNPCDTLVGSKSPLKADIIVLPSWPQPSLVPRDTQRGERCENVAYYGRIINLAEEMRSDTWSTEIKRLGFNWTVVNMDRWNDYSSTDVTISMRPLNERNLKNGSGFIFDADSKPSAKLTNSWLAGVPAIVGAEPAYQTIRRSALDYIEVRTPGETKEALQKLRRDKVLYKEMVDNGFERAKEYSVDSIKALWIESIDNEIINKYERWIGQSQAKRVLTAVGETISYFADIQNIKDILALIKK